MENENVGAIGASAARNKLASYLDSCGLRVQKSVPSCPPKDGDFLEAIAVAMRREDFKGLTDDRFVNFYWWQCSYSIPVPDQVISEISSGRLQRYDLFCISVKGRDSYFYLAQNDNNGVAVHRFKKWSGYSEMLDTEVD